MIPTQEEIKKALAQEERDFIGTYDDPVDCAHILAAALRAEVEAYEKTKALALALYNPQCEECGEKSNVHPCPDDLHKAEAALKSHQENSSEMLRNWQPPEAYDAVWKDNENLRAALKAATESHKFTAEKLVKAEAHLKAASEKRGGKSAAFWKPKAMDALRKVEVLTERVKFLENELRRIHAKHAH